MICAVSHTVRLLLPPIRCGLAPCRWTWRWAILKLPICWWAPCAPSMGTWHAPLRPRPLWEGTNSLRQRLICRGEAPSTPGQSSLHLKSHYSCGCAPCSHRRHCQTCSCASRADLWLWGCHLMQRPSACTDSSRQRLETACLQSPELTLLLPVSHHPASQPPSSTTTLASPTLSCASKTVLSPSPGVLPLPLNHHPCLPDNSLNPWPLLQRAPEPHPLGRGPLRGCGGP